MAFTGQFLLLFLLGHAAGNGTFWVGGINSYAAHLHVLPPLVWASRLGLLVLLLLHTWQGITLTLENRAASGGGCAVTAYRNATIASRTMIWSGLVIALGLHLFHGITSSVKTIGLNGPRSFPWLERAGIALSILVAAAFIAIPAGIFAGLMQ